MIKINLAKRKSSVVASADGEKVARAGIGGLADLGARLNIDVRSLERLRELPLKKPIAALVVAIIANVVLANFQEDELLKIDASIKKAEADKAKLRGDLDKTKGFEQIKKSLEGDEMTIKTKIEVIQKLILDRQKPPKLLLALSNLIPTEVWLNNFTVTETDLKLSGSALGLIQISDFMKNMSESADFTDVKLVSSDAAHESDGLESTHFDITAKRR